MSMYENVFVICFKFLMFLKYICIKIMNFREKNFFKNECCKFFFLNEFNIVSFFMIFRFKLKEID